MAKLQPAPTRAPPMLNTAIAPPLPKIADPFYSSREWVDLRDQVRREERGRCRTPGCTNRGTYVDHIVELKDGGAPLDRRNCQLLCASCHTRKTAAKRAERMASR